MSGQLIAIEGIDGSGKGTQAQRLVERLQAEGRRVALFSFPRYSETRFGRFVGEYLNGRFGTLEAVDPFLASLLFAGDRFESRDALRQALAENDVVICDRYVASNVAHQGAKTQGSGREELISRIEAVEFDVYDLPRPYMTFLLHLPVDLAQTLIACKPTRDYTDMAADLHEADGVYLQQVEAVYLSLLERSGGAFGEYRTAIPCSDGVTVHSRDAIADAIWNFYTEMHSP